MDCNEENSFHLISYEELLMPISFMSNMEEKLTLLKNIKYEEGDVMLCSYPKSGTHWMRGLLNQLFGRIKAEPDRPLRGLFEITPPEITKALLSPRIFTTHLRPRRFPQALIDNKCRSILVLRNPKDVIVSFYYHLKNASTFTNKQTWDEFFKSVIAGKVPYGSYFDYLNEWDAIIKKTELGLSNSKVEVFFFEDLKVSCFEQLRRLDSYLGLNKSDLELQEIEKACSIESLREKSKQEQDRLPESVKNKDGSSIIYRRGDVGDWKNHFTVAQNEIFDRLIQSELKGCSFDFKYEI